MRILFTTYSQRTHLFSMVPLAWALRTAGHEVRFANQPFFADEVTRAGLTSVPVGRHNTDWRRLAEANPEQSEPGLAPPYDAAAMAPEDVGWDAMRAAYRHMLDVWHKLNNFPLVGGLVDFARRWQPDLIIWEPTTYAGAIAAAACGAAHARLLWSVDVFGVTRDRYLRLNAGRPADDQADPIAEWLEGYCRRYGLEYSEELVTGQFTIDQLPDSMRMTAAGLHYLPMRYVPYGGPAVVPTWLQMPAERPRVALTLGNTATEQFAGYTVNVPDILDALSDLDIELVATVGESEQAKLTRVPDNARIVTYAPLDALAATCSVVINHAGPGTFLTTALHAVPQLTVPWEFDAPELARRAATQGGSLMIHAAGATGGDVRTGVLRLLGETRFARNAMRLRDDLLALPTPNRLVGQIEELTGTYAT